MDATIRGKLTADQLNAMTLQKEAAALWIEPRQAGAADVEAMAARVERLDLLYRAAGRDDPSSSMHGLYTGLHATPPF